MSLVSHEYLERMICFLEGEASELFWEMPEGESQGCSVPRKLAPLLLTHLPFPFVHVE